MSRFGLDGIDALVPEGIPRAGAVLVLVPAAEEKDQLAAQFVLEGLRNGDAAIVLESESGLRDLARRLGNMGLDADHAAAEGRLVLLDWAVVAAAREGAAAGPPAAKAALAGAIPGTKVFPGLRAVVDMSGTLPDGVDPGGIEALAVDLAEALKAAGSLSLFLGPRGRALAPAATEAFEVVLDLRPLKPSGFGLAVVTIHGTPLPRTHMLLETIEGRLVLKEAMRGAAPVSASVECPVCKSTIPAGAAECPVCKSPRPVRRPGEPEVLDYIEALGQRVGMPEATVEPTMAPEGAGREGEPATPEPPRRGLTNGLARRKRMAPPATAAPSGRVNGLTSTIIAARRGMTNGLTNGNGFTNGLGGRRSVAESRSGAWRVYLVPIIAFALLALPLLLGTAPAVLETYGIDGSFSEWTQRVALAPDPALPGSIDLTFAAVRADGERVYGFLETRETALAGTPDDTDVYRMFVDGDGDASTGYLAAGVGAEVLVEVAGAGGSIVSTGVFEYTGGGDRGDWSAWERADDVRVASGRGAEAGRIELSFPRATGRDGSGLRALFATASPTGREDVAEVALSPFRAVLSVTQRSTAPDAFSGAVAPLLELELRAPAGDASLAGLRLTAGGTLPPSALRGAVLRDVSATVLAQTDRYQSGFALDLASPLTVGASPQTLRVEVQVDPAAVGTVGLAIERDQDVHAQNATAYLRTTATDRDRAYVGPVPAGAVADGAYGEWPVPAPDPTGETSTGGSAAIDLVAYDSIRSGTDVAVFARTAGRFLEGGLVPVANPRVPKAFAPDTDRDTVPDSVEAGISAIAPFDFDNNGERDSDSGGDRDGDGVADYPGPDEWLNTTIPDTYPELYRGRRVSVFIGLVERPVTRGEHALRVFIDSDATPSTGYATVVGADWMVEVVGRGGAARSEGLYRFTGANPGAWSWTRVSGVSLAMGTRQVEFVASLTTAPVAGTQVVIDLRDWRGGFDLSGVATRSGTRSAGGTSVQAGAYDADLPAEVGGDIRVTSSAFTFSWRLADIGISRDGATEPVTFVGDGLESTASSASYDLRVGSTTGTLLYSFGPAALKEEIVVAAPPGDLEGASDLRIGFSVALSEGALLLPRGGDLFVAVGESVAARLPAPFFTDATGAAHSCFFGTPAPDRLDIACPAGALRSATYPVWIDPSTTFALSNEGIYDQAAGENFGWSVAVGNFNGDSYLDVLAGAPLNDKNASDAGVAFIFLGPFNADDSSPSVSLRGNGTTSYRAGYGVASGDFNNDGYDDAVVGQQNGGPTLVFYGRASWPSYEGTANVTFPVPSPVAAESFGRALASGDFDDDGDDDLVIGRPFYPSAGTPDGRAYLFFAPFAAYEPSEDLLLRPFNLTRGRFGISFAVGRIDSDTRADVIVGEVAVTAGASTFGRISLFKGSSLAGSGTKSPDATTIHLVSSAQFGSSVAVGTLNADSYQDVLVGAPAQSSNNGAAYVFLAKSDGTGMDTNQSIDRTFANQAAGEKFGTSVLIGDYLNDGGSDVIVGAETYNTDDGRVYVFDEPLTDQSTPDETLNAGSAGDNERFGHSLAGGKLAGDAAYVLVVGVPYWDDTAETDSGRAVIATIPEFHEVAGVAGLTLLLIVVARRRRRVR